MLVQGGSGGVGHVAVQPAGMAFDNGERPLNLVSDNMMWLNVDQLRWIDVGAGAQQPQAAFLWGDVSGDAISGSMLRLPRGQPFALRAERSALQAVIIGGQIAHAVDDVTAPASLGPGGCFASDAGVVHTLSCDADELCSVYLRTQGRWSIR